MKRWLGLAICVLLLSLPGASGAELSPPVTKGQEVPAVVPLRMQVKRLTVRVNKLEGQVAALRTLVCLQLPSC